MLIGWVDLHIHSKYVFLLLLNMVLLIKGTFMDVFSAIIVMVPLIQPIAARFGIDPVQIGIIFLANLELGYLTPPIGMNLCLSAYRFKQPMTAVYRATLPVYLILLVGVLLITYVPALTTLPVKWLRTMTIDTRIAMGLILLPWLRADAGSFGSARRGTRLGVARLEFLAVRSQLPFEVVCPFR